MQMFILNNMADIYKQITGIFIYIIGFTGSGKLSTAVELSNMIDALIVSSVFPHDSPIYDLYNNTFGRECVSREAQDRVYNIIQIMLSAIECYPILSKNYIFFDELIEDSRYNTKIYDSVVNLSEKMSAKILPVVLRCNLSTLQQRIELKNKTKKQRFINSNSIMEKLKNKTLFVPPNSIEIDNSNMSVKEVAEVIFNKMYQMS